MHLRLILNWVLNCYIHGTVIVTMLWTGLLMKLRSISVRHKKFFSFSKVSRLVLGPTQSPILWVSGVKNPVPKLRMSKVVLTLPHIPL